MPFYQIMFQTSSWLSLHWHLLGPKALVFWLALHKQLMRKQLWRLQWVIY